MRISKSRALRLFTEAGGAIILDRALPTDKAGVVRRITA
jgi:hypothetical protein